MQLVTFERRERTGRRLRIGAEPGTAGAGSMGVAALGYETLDAVRHGTLRLGAIVPGGAHAGALIDLNRALAVKLAAEDAGAPECEADSLLPAEPLAFLRRLPLALGAARDTLAFASDALERYDGPDLLGAGIALPRREVRLASPVQRPGKVVAVVPEPAFEEPALFLRSPSCVAGPDDDLRLPPGCGPLGFHGELAAVIGKRARAVAPDAALSHVAGYCAALSIHPLADGARRWLEWSGDGFAPIGPALVTPEELPDPHDLRLRTRLSGQTLQTAHTKELPLPLAEAVARISRAMTLEPGDVVLSGPPLGGAGDRPSRALRDGDVLEVEIERVGRLAIYARIGS